MPTDSTPRMIDIEATPGFTAWLRQAGASLAFTSYRSGEIFTIGVAPGGELTATNCGLERCMGLGVGPNGLWVASAFQLWRFENILPEGTTHNGHDALFLPLNAHTTGEIDVHDIAELNDGRPVFVATRFNCLAGLAAGHSFEAFWMPPFIDQLIAEDRCHLNGLALRDGRPFAVTAVANTSTSGAWREHRRDGGLLIGVDSGEVMGSGLSMPHSPRWYNGRIWLHQSGTGEFGFIDPDSCRFEPVCFLPGFLRGLAFLERWALVGVSRPRTDSGFDGLPLQDRLAREGRNADCALYIIDLENGSVLHRVAIGPDVDEIYDVALLPRTKNPCVVKVGGDDIRYLLRPLDVRSDRRRPTGG